MAKFLIEECGADVNEYSDTGFTALHVACDRDMVDMANYLVRKGARLDAKDAKGRTPLDVCGSIGLDKQPDSIKKSLPGKELNSSNLSTSSVKDTLELVADDQFSRSITPTTEHSDTSESGKGLSISRLDLIDCLMSFKSTVTSPSLLSVHQKIADLNMRSGRQPMPENLLSAIRQPKRRSTTNSRYRKQYEATCHEHEIMSMRSSSSSQIIVGPLSFNDDSRAASITSEDYKHKGPLRLWERLQEDEERVSPNGRSGEQKGSDSFRVNSVKSYLQSKTSVNIRKFSPKAAPSATTQSVNDMKWGGKGDRRVEVNRIDRDRYRVGRDKNGDDDGVTSRQSTPNSSIKEMDRYIKGQVQLRTVSASDDSSDSDSDSESDDDHANDIAAVTGLPSLSNEDRRLRSVGVSMDSSDSDIDHANDIAAITGLPSLSNEDRRLRSVGVSMDSSDSDIDLANDVAITATSTVLPLSNGNKVETCRGRVPRERLRIARDREGSSDSDDDHINATINVTAVASSA